jgi:hypothetical protein
MTILATLLPSNYFSAKVLMVSTDINDIGQEFAECNNI